ncbi:hypothetical protein SS05631_c16310 [Sinorhizobium sp. CCBAU 05631]|nr:hypothetical protein SS05631_c16310 [Sinorhizobium sp. CCBAU 05631]
MGAAEGIADQLVGQANGGVRQTFFQIDQASDQCRTPA